MTVPAQAYLDGELRRYRVEGLDPGPLSVTTLLRSIAPAIQLVKWLDGKIINAALDAYDKSHDQEHAVVAGKNARFSGNEEADLGTSVHALTEEFDRVALGQQQKVRAVADMKKVLPYARQWEKLRDSHGMQILAVEATLVNTHEGYAGTADRIVVIPALAEWPIVLDIKSGKRVYPDVALQCAALANCDKILYDDGKLADIPWELNKDIGAVAHVRARSAKLYPLDLHTAWPIFQPLPRLAEWRGEKIDVVGEEVAPDDDLTLRADLRLRMTELPPDLQQTMRGLIADAGITGSSTAWTSEQVKHVDGLFAPYETLRRERQERVLRAWLGGDEELRLKILTLTQGRTTLIGQLVADEIDQLLKECNE